MAGQTEHTHDLKAEDCMTPPRKLLQHTEPPKISRSRAVYPVRIGPLLPSLDDCSDEEPEDSAPVKPWSRSA